MVLSFDNLPEAVNQLNEKLSRIEQLLQNKFSENVAESDELLTIRQAAELLSLSIHTMYGYVNRREVPYSKIKKRLYFSKQELIGWAKAARRKTVEEIATAAEQSLKRKK